VDSNPTRNQTVEILWPFSLMCVELMPYRLDTFVS